MSNKKVDELIKQISKGYNLPLLSPTAIRLIETISQNNTSISDIVAIIEEDPSLTVRLLRFANSPFYRITSPITTINDAILRIGLNQLRLMALSLSIKDTFPLSKYGPMDYEQFWKISLYQALFARRLAQTLGNCNPDEAFVAGLISEIGLLIFFDLFIKDKDMDIQLNLYPFEELLDFEEKRYGVNHRKIGEAALRYWRLPEAIVVCQRFNRNTDVEQLTPLAFICEIARKCADFICFKDMNWNNLYIEFDRKYKIRHEVISDIMAEVFNVVETTAQNLKIKIDRQNDIGVLAEKANSYLANINRLLTRAPEESFPSFESLKANRYHPIVSNTLQAVAHEIRNPLTILGGFARRLETIITPNSKEWDYVQQIIEETKRLESVLASMITKNS
ncbi:MAG: HDOD domain-containing protein [Thermodesulfovibrionales bacterium]|nr:HDOD domain-containing protein [Thermodesulfovibrionales bacterium]